MTYDCPEPDCPAGSFPTEQARNGHIGTAHNRVYVQVEIIHGTPAGYRTHKRRKENACSECKQAWRNKKYQK